MPSAAEPYGSGACLVFNTSAWNRQRDPAVRSRWGATLDTAEQCLEDTAQAGDDGASECKKQPIFASGSDVPSATEHDLKALALEPGWVKLNYESVAAKKEKGEERGWYEGLGGCSGARPEGEQCDEYPFFATEQGGPGGKPTPNLEYINADTASGWRGP